MESDGTDWMSGSSETRRRFNYGNLEHEQGADVAGAYGRHLAEGDIGLLHAKPLHAGTDLAGRANT
jgi:hypothetical protein